MIIGKESEKLEFKKSTAELKEGVISMSAILNKHGGGELYFGVLNDGTPFGQMVGASTLRDISQAVSNHIEPQIYPKISEAVINNKRCIHVEFTGDDAPYFAYGRAYVRVADEDKQMTPAELKDYIRRQNAKTYPWDSEASQKTPDDIDDDAFKLYVERANQAGRIGFEYTTKEDALTRLNLLIDGKLKNAAAVLFCGESLIELQTAVFATTERFTFHDIGREGGSIINMIDVAEKYLRRNLRWRVVFDGSIQRNEIPEIPLGAAREAIINSFCHRDYRSTQNNEVVIYSNRVEIYNPGTFPEEYTPQDFIDGMGSSVKRNPLLANLMYYVRDIESFGTGLKRIVDECSLADVKVEFQMRKMGFAVVFYRPINHINTGDSGYSGSSINENITTNINAGVSDNIVYSIADDIADSIAGSETVNGAQARIISLMRAQPCISANQIAQKIGIAQRNVQVHIKSLKDRGLIRREGAAFGGHWIVNLPMNSASSDEVGKNPKDL